MKVQNFTDLLYSHMYYPTITRPTRVTNVSATLIDHIWTNDLNYFTSGIIYTSVSDHLPVFSSFSSPVIKSRNDIITIHKRVFSDNNIDYFSLELWKYIQEPMVSETDLNEM